MGNGNGRALETLASRLLVFGRHAFIGGMLKISASFFFLTPSSPSRASFVESRQSSVGNSSVTPDQVASVYALEDSFACDSFNLRIEVSILTSINFNSSFVSSA